MKYYLDFDTRENCCYVVPYAQLPEHRYLIKFKTRYEADQFWRKLEFSGEKNPLQDKRMYELTEILEEVNIYRLK